MSNGTERSGSRPRRGEATKQWLLDSLVSADEAKRRLRLGLTGTNDLITMVRNHQILALPTPASTGPDITTPAQAIATYQFPAFQFTPEGAVYPVVADVVQVLAEVSATPYTAAYFLTSTQQALGGRRPAECLDDPEAQRTIRNMARGLATRLSH